MGLDHADLVLIHWPAPDDDPPVRDPISAIWPAAQDRGQGRVKIGVSNFTRRLMSMRRCKEIGEGRIETNQVERHVFLQNRVLAEHCQAASMAITAYRPLGGSGLDESEVLLKVARRHGAEPSQIALAYLLALGSIVIPKSATPDRQESNLAAGEIRLDQEDMDAIAALDCGKRCIDPEWGPDWD